MSAQLVTELTILVLAAFVGFEVISKVPTLLHTPLMSGTNAIHGIVIVGAIIVMGTPHPSLFMRILSFIAVVLASANVVGGFVVTDRMGDVVPVVGHSGEAERTVLAQVPGAGARGGQDALDGVVGLLHGSSGICG